MISVKKITSLLAVTFVFLSAVLLFPHPAFAATSYAVTGKANSSLGGTTKTLDFTDYNSNVTVNVAPGGEYTFSGYAFSEDVGWVAFGTTDNSAGPVYLNTTTGAVTGKAKVLNTGAYIDFTNYNSNVTVNLTTGAFSGYAFSEDAGWFNFGSPGVSAATFTVDSTTPTTNASGIGMNRSNGGSTVSSGGWTNTLSPYFSWTAGADNGGGTGILGYCLYLGTDSSGNPATAKGLLGTSPVSTTGTTCQFIVSATSIDFATTSYRGSTWLTTSSLPYYLNAKAIDNAGNIYGGSSTQFSFYFDSTAPTNVSYISPAAGNFSNVADMNFSWPTSGSAASSDTNAGVLGWQYQINSSSGAWQGTTHSTDFNLDYIPATASAYYLVPSRDTSAIVTGSNVIYFRTVDAAGNTSSDNTIRTGNLSYGGAAPTFGGNDSVTVTPTTTTTNSFALAYPAATPSNGHTVTHYYYMVNVSPPSTLATLQGTATTYIDNGTSLTVAAGALANVTKGTNTVYVVAIDDTGTPNYSSSNDIKGTFTLNSTNPDPVGNLVASDSSIKSQSKWNVTLTWTAPTYQGAGNLTYNIYRSSNDVTFAKVGSTSGLSYVDNTPSSTLYYYYVVTQDGASAISANSSTVSITPTGRYTSAPVLQTNPSAGSITTQSVTITWSTDRSADSKIEYGTSTGSYNTTQPYVSSQVTSHSVTINNLSAGTTYYYKAQWTDADGNTGTSAEYSFSTTSAPTVSAVSASGIGLTTAYINFTISNGSSAVIQYGPTTSYGGSVTQSTSNTSAGAIYSVPLTSLTDGTQYHYRIVMADASGNTYNSDDYTDLKTLPRPKVTNIQLSQVAGTAQTTVLATWTSNTPVSSIVTYWPEGNSAAAQDTVNVAFATDHQMIIRGLEPKTNYLLVVKGRDKIGNEATSDSQQFTTATDTRPPQLLDVNVEGSTVPLVTTTAQESSAQFIVSWDTDKPSTSQVEFGEGTGTSYSQKTQQDANLTTNHLVVISGLTPSKVYHLRAISVDKWGNIGDSIDTVSITPKATDNALNLVITNLQAAFGFLGTLGH